MDNNKSKKGASSIILIGAILALLIIIGVVYFSKTSRIENADNVGINNTAQDSPETDNPQDAMAGDETSNGNDIAETNIKVFNLIGTNFSFSVKNIRVKKGDTVRINLKSDEGFHDFKIDEFNASTKRVNTGEEASVEFIADKTGTFEYYCSVGNHRQQGMVGTLIVE